MITIFENYIKESHLEIVEIKRSMHEIHDELITYDAVQDYLQKELLGETVNVSVAINLYNEEIYDDIDINVIDISINDKLQNIFIDRNGTNFLIPDASTLKWEKLISRQYGENDPYGEEVEE